MLTISPAYGLFLKRRSREWLLKVKIDGVEYGTNQIVDIQIENEIAEGQNDFAIGTANISRCVLRLRTVAEIPPNAEVIPYVALSLAGMTWDEADVAWDDADFAWDGSTGTDWLPLGTFYIDNRRQQNKVWTFECYDALTFADIAYVSQLSYPATMQAVWNEACAQTGLTYDVTSVQINPSYTVPVAPTGYTCRQVLGFIAGAHGASVYAGRDGKLRWRKYAAAESPVYDMTEADYIRVKQTNPPKVYTKIVVTYDPDEQLAYEAGSGDENHTLYLVNPLMTQTMVNNLLLQINGFSYVPVEMDARGYPQLEHGDRISFDRTESMSWLEADVAWDAADFPWDGVQTHQTLILRQTFTFKGGLGMSLAAPSKSEQESEFPVKGTLTEAVERLNQNAVKKDKIYYGLSISDSYGLKVQRSDGKSDLTLNSDVMDWKVDGISALHYDAQAGKLKFRGDIIMEGGSISWSNVNAPDIDDIPDLSGYLTYIGPTGIYTGTIEANQINANSLSAISANLGTVTAGSIFGVTITGGVITGALIQTDTSGSYPRIELSSTAKTLTAEFSPLSNISIKTSGGPSTSPAIVFTSGSMTTFHYQDDVFGHIIATVDPITIQGTSAINVSSNSFKINGGIPFDTIPHPNSTATTVSGIVADFNSLLGVLRSLNILA